MSRKSICEGRVSSRASSRQLTRSREWEICMLGLPLKDAGGEVAVFAHSQKGRGRVEAPKDGIVDEWHVKEGRG